MQTGAGYLFAVDVNGKIHARFQIDRIDRLPRKHGSEQCEQIARNHQRKDRRHRKFIAEELAEKAEQDGAAAAFVRFVCRFSLHFHCLPPLFHCRKYIDSY